MFTNTEWQGPHDILNSQCECADPGCPVHNGKSVCLKRAIETVRRIDMEDGNTTFRMCEACASDALDSGVFA